MLATCAHSTNFPRFTQLELHKASTHHVSPTATVHYVPETSKSSGRNQGKKPSTPITIAEMATLSAARASDLSLPSNTYIYKILPTGPRAATPSSLAVLSSDNSVRFVDPSNLSLLPDGMLERVHDSVTCLERAGNIAENIIATAGRDGAVKFWDSRLKGNAKAVMTVQSRK